MSEISIVPGILKSRSYTYTKPGTKEQQQETVTLIYPSGSNIRQLLHTLGLELVMRQKEGREGSGELTLAELLDTLTPEMLAPYRVHILRPNRDATQADKLVPVISRYEAESYRKLLNYEQATIRRIRDYAPRFVQRLEREKANEHPAISTWSSAKISSMAVSWSGQFVMGKTYDFEEFCQKKLADARPARTRTPAVIEPEPVPDSLEEAVKPFVHL